MGIIVLASASPRRLELLSKFGFDLKVIVSNADESIDDSKECSEIVKDLAYLKAHSVAEGINENCIIIGADTVVACDGQILGKPKDEDDAFNMLKMLSGKTHQVYTGYCIIRNPDAKVVTGFEKTDVTFIKLSDDEIYSYIKTNEPMDKAGAYGIQGIGSAFVQCINGDYNNVVGLPVCKILQSLKNDYNVSIY